MEKGRTRYVWPTIVILSLLVIGFSILFMSMTELVFDTTMERTGSAMTWESLDEDAAAGLRFIITKPDRYEIWFGIIGLLCAWGIKRKESFAWKLGILWSVMLIVSGIVLAVYELLILGWSTICLQVPEFIIIGGIALACLIIVKGEFPRNASEAKEGLHTARG